MTEIKTALTIGGSDPSGCGGIQGDIKVFSSYGVYGMSVITAVTSQNSSGVSGIAEAPASLVAEQFQSVYDDIKIDSLKIGMLSSSDNLTMVSQILGELNLKNIVLDPVFLSSDGTPLLDADAIKTMVELLLPLVEIITPNLDEASKLAGMNVVDLQGMEEAAVVIKGLGPANVLIKGGHLKDRAVDILYDGMKTEVFDSPRIKGKDFRGTGCALSAAITAGLANGGSILDSVQKAKKFITRAINTGYDDLGKGMSILNHNLPVS